MITGNKILIDGLLALHKRRIFPQKAILFGEPNIGKYTIARALAYCFERGKMPHDSVGRDSELPALTDALFLGSHPGDVLGIDEARRVKEFLWQKPFVSPYRTIVIRDADRLTEEAQNALLKISEEPPTYGVIMITIKNPELLRPTLVSRFEQYYCAPVSKGELLRWLAASHQVSRKKAEEIAKQSFGKPGLACRLLYEPDWQMKINTAEKFFTVTPSARRNFLKTLLEDPSFQLRDFLDTLLLVLAGDSSRRTLWHAVVELRRMVQAVPLNPKIQLAFLWTKLSKH